ncbi:MAG: hypothetical protein ACFFHV_02045 [Promethearchaeota archaeon]
MSKFKIIIKKDCFFCDKLKQWLADKDIDVTFLDYLDPKDFDDPLMKNQTFYTIYCDFSACVESIPIVVKNDKEFYYGEIWDLVNNEIIEEKAKQIFEI